jgi:HSP20 family protein
MSTIMTRHLNTIHPSLLGRGVFEDLLGSFFNDIPVYVKQTTAGYPVADIYRNDDGATTMEFALAGFSKDEISVEVKPEKRSITVSATTSVSGDQDHSRRIARRNFEKTYVNYDDNLDMSNAIAKYENGLLTVTVPTRPEAKPVTISIE